MNPKLIFSIAIVCCVCLNLPAQTAKKKPNSSTKTTSTTVLSVAEKMPYARTNKHWGPGTYYSFAPGKPNVKMEVNGITAMRDLTGISREDCLAEITKQGYTGIPPKEVPKWFYSSKSKEVCFYYSPDKSSILYPGFLDMYNSKFTNPMPFATERSVDQQLLPITDSVKVLDMAWQYMRDLYDLKIQMTFSSNFKKFNPKAWPTEMTGTNGWNGFRAGTASALRMVDGKPRIDYTRNEAIIRRTIGKPEFRWMIMGYETDFGYSMEVNLKKEGYVITYTVISKTMSNLEPGSNWVAKHKDDVKEMQLGEKGDKDIIEIYKKAPMPPKMEDLNMLLHTR